MSHAPAPLPRLLRTVCRSFAVVGTLGVAALMVLVDFDIVGRQVFSQPVGGVAELAALGIVVVVFLQAPWALASDRMIRADLLVGIVRGLSPRAARLLEAVLCLAGAAMFALVAHAVFPEFVRQWRSGDVYGDPSVFTLAKWPTSFVVALGSTLLALVYLFQALGWLRSRGEKDPS